MKRLRYDQLPEGVKSSVFLSIANSTTILITIICLMVYYFVK